MTHDKVRQDFEANPAFKYMDFAIDKDAWGREKYKDSHIQALFEGYQAGRAAERAEIVAKLESESILPDCTKEYAIASGLYNVSTWGREHHIVRETITRGIKAAITKILEVI